MTADTELVCPIVVNGDQMTTKAGTLAELLSELGLTDQRVATARNGDFVPEKQRSQTRLDAGDRIEIVSPRHGG